MVACRPRVTTQDANRQLRNVIDGGGVSILS